MEKNKIKKDGAGGRVGKVSGYILFTQDYYEKKKSKNEKCKRIKDESKLMKEAWNALKDDEKETYRLRAKNFRSEAKGAKYVVPFSTRCAPGQFVKVCEGLKNGEGKMERLKKVGFDKLVNINCSQIPRDLCGQFMSAFDPPTNTVSIRGRSLHIRREDVKQFLGLPCEGGEIEKDGNEEEEEFGELKKLYGSVPYKTIGKRLLEREEDAEFELLFVMYALGTLLSPGSSIKVSDRVLRVLAATKGALGEYDWSTFVLTELSTSLAQYKNKMRKGKDSGRINVGGCIYFFMVSGTRSWLFKLCCKFLHYMF